MRPPLAAETVAPVGDERTYFHRVFAWMAVGLGVTGGIAGAIGSSSTALHVLFGSHGQAVIIVSLILELVLVAVLVGLVRHMSLVEAGATFLAYAALNGLTLSLLFAVYTTKSIFSTFLVTAAMFAGLAIWGYTTKRDLTGWGNFLFMALLGQLVGLLVNLFWLNETLYWVTTATGVLIFSAYTAFDVQKLKQYEPSPGSDIEVAQRDAIVGALALYLDFVNLFLYLLRIFGRSRR
jgi:FtsH-binding integral membrane protein